jgi:hypothetical protein
MNFSLKKKFVRDTRLNELIIILAEMTRHNWIYLLWFFFSFNFNFLTFSDFSLCRHFCFMPAYFCILPDFIQTGEQIFETPVISLSLVNDDKIWRIVFCFDVGFDKNVYSNLNILIKNNFLY